MSALLDMVAVLQGPWPGRCPARDRALAALLAVTGESLGVVLGLCREDFYCLDAVRDAPFDLRTPGGKLFGLEPGVRGAVKAAIRELERRGWPCGEDAPVLQGRPGRALSASRARRILVGAFGRAGLPTRGVPGRLRELFRGGHRQRRVSRDAVDQAVVDHAVDRLNLGMP